MRRFEVIITDTQPHSKVAKEMKRLQQLRIADEIPDLLILTEHPEVVTVGPRARAGGVEVPFGYPTTDIDRGGGITWHGSGQMVAYPIFKWDLPNESNVATITSSLEDWLAMTLSPLGIRGVRNDAMQGIWVGGKKVASIGLNFLKWTSRHGFTLNYDTPEGRIENLPCCGLEIGTTTSLARIGFPNLTRSSLEALLLATAKWAVDREVGEIHITTEGELWPF